MKKQNIDHSEARLEGGLEKSGRVSSRPSRSRSVPTQIGRLFYALGFFGASYPIFVIIFSIVVVLVSCYPLVSGPFPGNRPKEFITPYENYSSPSLVLSEENVSSWPRWYKGPQALFVQQILVKSSVYPWSPNLIVTDAFRGTLSESFELVEIIKNFTIFNKDGSVGLSQLCFRVSDVKSKALKGKNSMLPENNCLILSPTNFWHQSYPAFQNDPDILGTILNYQSHKKGKSGLAEILLGVNVKDTGLKRHPFKAKQRVLTYAVTLILERYNPEFIEKLESTLKTHYGSKLSHLPKANHREKNDESTTKKPDVKEKKIVHVFYPSHSSLLQLLPLGLTYITMFIYVYFSVKKIEMIKSKLGIAFSALAAVVASLCMSVALCTHFGVIYEVDAKAIFPYVVVIIGLENMLVLTRSVVSTAPHLDAKIRVAQGLSKEGWSIIKNLSAEVSILTIGFFTFIPKIQEFCILAIVGLMSDFFIQTFFFATVLSIDIRRNERNVAGSHHPSSAFTPFRKPKHPRLDRVKSNPGLSNGSVPSNHLKNGGSVPVVAPSQLSPILVKIPKRLRVISFWARTRFFQRTFVICMIGWISFIIYESGIIMHSNVEADDVVIPNVQLDDVHTPRHRLSLSVAQNASGSVQNNILLQKNKSQEALSNKTTADEIIHQDAKILNDMYECNPHTWRRLSLYHWQVLLGIYNVSLSGKHISILPPICVSVPVDPSIAISRRNIHEQDQASKFNWQALTNKFEPVDFLDEYDSGAPSPTNSKVEEEGFFYYFSSWDDPYIPTSPIELALTVLLAIPNIIFISYCIIVFYRCACSRNYAEWRSSWFNYSLDTSDYYTQVVFEAVPLVLDGHKQEVECIGSDGNVIASVCLDGVLKIWNINTGDSITTVDRKRYFHELSVHNDPSTFFLGSDAESPTESSPPNMNPSFEGSNFTASVRRQQRYSWSESPSYPAGLNNSTTTTVYEGQVYNETQSISTAHTVQTDCDNGIHTGSHGAMKFYSNHIQQYDNRNRTSVSSSPIPIPIETPLTEQTTYPTGSVNSFTGSTLQHSLSTRAEFAASNASLNSLTFQKTNRIRSYSESPVDESTESPYLNETQPVWCLDCVENIVVLGTGSGRIEFWDACAGLLKCTYDDDSGIGVMCVKLIGNKIVAAKINGALDFLQLELHAGSRNCESPSLYNRCHNNGMDDRRPVYGYESEIRCVWLSTQKAHQQPITCLDCDNVYIITGSQDHSLKVFRLEDQLPFLTLHGHYGPVTCVFIDKLSPLTSGSGSQDGLLCVWDLQTGMCVYSIQAHDGPISALTYSVSYIISAGGDDKICVWERFQGHLLNTIQLDHAYCSSLVMLTHNLLITSKQGSLIVWDVRSGDAVRAVRLGHRDNTVFVRQIMTCSDAVLCDYGSQLRLVRFPSVVSKVD